MMGPSGSGKSTLMHCVAGLDTLTAGHVYIGDVDLATLSDRQLTLLRRDRIGFVFQAFNLVPTLTARENIVLPTASPGAGADTAWLDEVVATVGLGDRLAHRPAELSGGQQQRVAVARALAGRPRDRLRRRADRQPRLAGRAPRSSASCAGRWTSWARPSSWSPTTRSAAGDGRPVPCSWPTAASSTTSVPHRRRRPRPHESTLGG